MDPDLMTFLNNEEYSPLVCLPIGDVKYCNIGGGFLEIYLEGDEYPPSITLDYITRVVILNTIGYNRDMPVLETKRILFDEFEPEELEIILENEVIEVINYMNNGFDSKYRDSQGFLMPISNS